jgi:hypothetical protein
MANAGRFARKVAIITGTAGWMAMSGLPVPLGASPA